MEFNKKIVFGGAISTILLGAIGSGVWEYALRPASAMSSNFVLGLISFGIKRFKDQIYLEIAKNFHESVGLEILSFITAALLSLVFVTGFAIVAEKYIKRYIKKYGFEQDETDDRKKLYYKIFVIFYLIFAISFIHGNFLRMRYIDRSITNYNQLLVIVEPYINEEEKLKIASSFAQIKNKGDYESIIQRLKDIAVTNKIDISNIE